MTAPDTPALAGMSIGAVLESLRPDFPDVTISKIRFLEAEGLVTPQRSGSGYRRFTAYDCARLRFILTAQRITTYRSRSSRRSSTHSLTGPCPRPDPVTAYRDWCRFPTMAELTKARTTPLRWRPPRSG